MSRLSSNHFSNGVNISTLVTFTVKFACVESSQNENMVPLLFEI